MSSYFGELLEGLIVAGRFRVVRALHADARALTLEAVRVEAPEATLTLRLFMLPELEQRHAAIAALQRYEQIAREHPALTTPVEFGEIDEGKLAGSVYVARDERGASL